MESFQFASRTKLALGPAVEREIGENLRPYGDCVLVVPGGEAIRSADWYREILDSLSASGIHWIELCGVRGNPDIGPVREGAETARSHNVGAVLSVGGGSAVDTAKAVALGACYDGDVWDFFTKNVVPTRALPVACIMTIPSSGSEASNGAVISNDETSEKLDVIAEVLRPELVLMNPALTASVPRRHLMAGIVDMFSHITERYFSRSSGVEVTDRLAEGLMLAIMTEADRLLVDFENLDARANLMLASVLAHNGLVGMGRQQDWATHAIAAPLSGEFGCIHGETIAVILPHWARLVAAEHPERFAQLGGRVFGAASDGTDAEAAAAAICGLSAFFSRLGMPAKLSDLGVGDVNRFESLAAQATRGGTIGNLKELSANDVCSIYKLAS